MNTVVCLDALNRIDILPNKLEIKSPFHRRGRVMVYDTITTP